MEVCEVSRFVVEIFVDYGSGFEPDGSVEFDTVLDLTAWKFSEKAESLNAIAEGDYIHKRFTVNGEVRWEV